MESPEKVAAGRHAMKDSVHVDRLDRLRADGNAAFKTGNLQSAKRHYTAAISLAESMPDEPVEKLVPTRRAQLLANRCQVSLALEKVAEALSDAQASTHPHPHPHPSCHTSDRSSSSGSNHHPNHNSNQAACSSAPGWPKAHYRLGTVHLYRRDYLKAYGAFKQAWHLDVSNQELVKACQDAYELLSGRDRDRTGKAQVQSQEAGAPGTAEASTAGVASAAIHAAAAEQTEKAARAAQGGEREGSEAEGTGGGGSAPNAAAPPAAAAAAATPPAAAAAAAATPPAAPAAAATPPAAAAAAPPTAAAAPPAQPSAAERTPAHSFADAEGGGLVLCVEVPELSSMGSAELEVSAASFSLYVPQLYRLGPLAWPRPVDVDAARAKFLKKRGVLQVTLPDMCV